jgi:hypothetical protein
MEPDYPAAHSQDTDWYAIDVRGHVALFKSGENGHVPEGVHDQAVLWELWDLCEPPASKDEAGERWLDPKELAPRLGLFFYDYAEGYDPIEPYHRMATPAAPLHVDQLPPGLREQCQGVRFAEADFSEAPFLQPLEFYPCDFWYRSDRVAYLAGDGMTVRPLPGKEDQFAAFCEKFRHEEPERAARFRFEGLEGGQPAKKTTRPRRKKKGDADGT